MDNHDAICKFAKFLSWRSRRGNLGSVWSEAESSLAVKTPATNAYFSPRLFKFSSLAASPRRSENPVPCRMFKGHRLHEQQRVANCGNSSEQFSQEAQSRGRFTKKPETPVENGTAGKSTTKQTVPHRGYIVPK